MAIIKRKQSNYGKVISFGLQKGGVGKTTTSILTAGLLAEKYPDLKILAIDNDPQGNLTTGLCPDIPDVDEINPTIFDLILDRATFDSTKIQVKNNLWLLPANTDLSALDVFVIKYEKELGERKFTLLKDAIEKIKEQFDYIFIDLPPQLGFLTILGLVASDSVILTMQTEPWARRAVPKFIQTIENTLDLNPNLQLAGILGTMADARTSLSSNVMSNLRKTYAEYVFDTVIKRTVRLSEVSLLGFSEKAKEIKTYYNDFIEELVQRGVIKAK